MQCAPEPVALPGLALHVRSHAGVGAAPVDAYAVTLGDGASLHVQPMRDAGPVCDAPAHAASCRAWLTPLGLLAVFREPLCELAGKRLALDAFCGSPRQLGLCAALTLKPRARTFASWLEARLAEQPPLAGPLARVAGAAATICDAEDGAIDIQALAVAQGITRRQLERDFRFWLGVAPKAYARRVRFERAAAALAGGRSILDAALGCGYADQSHMTRVFGALARATPRQFALRAAARSG